MREPAADCQTWLAARRLLLERCDEFYRQLVLVRENFDPESIHDLRVASRRLREGLSLFADCFRKKMVLPLRRELKTLTTRLGAIRNSDEALLFFTALQAEVAGAATAVIGGMVATLQAERDSQRRILTEELQKLAPGDLLRRIDTMCSKPRLFDPALPQLFDPVTGTLLGAIAVRSAALQELLPAALVAADIAAQHRLRIAVKRFRYRLEFLAPFAAQGYKEIYAVVKGFQELLGQMHDLDVFAGLAKDMITDQSARDIVAKLIADRRQRLFARFTEQNSRNPLDSLGGRVRKLL